MELRGSHVVVTGASRGIGAAMARSFAEAGARVSVVARNAEQLAALAEELGGKDFPADLLDPEAVDGLVDRIEGEAGPIDVLVNNAGLVTTDWLANLDAEQCRQVVRLNLEAPVVLTNRMLPRMMDRNRGHLVYTSSLAGTAGFPGLAVYGATKAGLLNFVAALRLELKGTEVATTVVAPGPVDTDMMGQLDRDDGMAPTLRRLRLLQLIPTKEPSWLAQQTVAAVAAGKPHVRSPRRLSSNFWLNAAPSRITTLSLKGVSTGPRA